MEDDKIERYRKQLNQLEEKGIRREVLVGFTNFVGEFYKYNKDWAKAREFFIYAASENNPDALYNLGCIFPKTSGGNLPKLEDMKENITYLGLAAKLGHSGAPLQLGHMHRANNALEEAFKWYALSAKKKNPMGQLWVGTMYRNGEGVQENPMQALKYYVLAANGNDVEVQQHLKLFFTNLKNYNGFHGIACQATGEIQAGLGRIFFMGLGVEKDYIEAFEWIERGLCAGSTDAIKFYPAIKKQFLPTLETLGQEGLGQELKEKYVRLYEKADWEYNKYFMSEYLMNTSSSSKK